VNQLSEGQQRRVALSRLWLKAAKIWILDEPFTALDVYAVEQVQSQITRFTQQGGCVVLTSHQPMQHIDKYDTFELEFRF
jgi:heme exporter protein A